MTACRECLLEAAGILEAADETFSTPELADHLRQVARTAPSWALEAPDDRAIQIGDLVEVLLYSPPDGAHWERVRVLSFWRGGFDWTGEGVAGRVTWNEEGVYWRRVGAEVDVFDSELARFDSRVRDVGKRLAAEPDWAGRVKVGVDPFATTLPHPHGPCRPCRTCKAEIRAHVQGLCVRCWQEAGRPEGPIEVVAEAGEPRR